MMMISWYQVRLSSTWYSEKSSPGLIQLLVKACKIGVRPPTVKIGSSDLVIKLHFNAVFCELILATWVKVRETA